MCRLFEQVYWIRCKHKSPCVKKCHRLPKDCRPEVLFEGKVDDRCFDCKIKTDEIEESKFKEMEQAIVEMCTRVKRSQLQTKFLRELVLDSSSAESSDSRSRSSGSSKQSLRRHPGGRTHWQRPATGTPRKRKDSANISTPDEDPTPDVSNLSPAAARDEREREEADRTEREFQNAKDELPGDASSRAGPAKKGAKTRGKRKASGPNLKNDIPVDDVDEDEG